ncbi:hypothetical protein CF081_19535 [Clostridium botulinum]|uniref:hypothetical protein n=1 Tax=Clostridium botulinum TaxID=1491 RepID=UPI000C7665DF|nr:hypothetical protein [Clostridium botulinum]AUN08931.1 hypothetical protein RSJ14_19910 [Clostridium botulinum]MBO0555640.1 hypothetical protein [Clostridium botulinum]
MLKRWSPKEIQLLKKYCGKIPNKELFKMFSNRTKRAVLNKAVEKGYLERNGIVEKEQKIREKENNFNIKIQNGDYVKVDILHENARKTRNIKGTITDITKYFILIKSNKYKECFLKNDLKCGRVKIEVLNKCS